MTAKILLAAALGGLALAGCDSMTQLTTSNAVSSAPTVNATENIAASGATPTITFVFPASSLPSSLTSGANPKVVLGGKPVSLGTGPNGSFVAALPPQTPPPSADLNGNTVLVFQTDSGSQLIRTHLNVVKS